MADCDVLASTLFDKRALAGAGDSHYCNPQVLLTADHHEAVSSRLFLNDMPYRSSYWLLAPGPFG